jgi:glycosyltransferase involved in cell wall biosynthesis
MPKIAILSHTHPSVTRGGAEISAYTLYSGLRDLGHDAAFIAACPTRDRAKVMLQSPDEHVVFYEPGEYDAFYHVAPPQMTAQVESLLADIGADVAIFHHLLFFGANTIRRVADSGVATALTLHEFLILCNNHGQMVTNPAQRLCSRSHPVACAQCFPAIAADQFAARQAFLLESLAGVRAFISPSQFLIDRFAGWGFPSERFHLVENGLTALAGLTDGLRQAGIEAAPLPPLLARPRPPGDATQPPLEVASDEADRAVIIGFFGQLNPFKGIDVIIEAAERLNDTPGPWPTRFRIHGNIVSLPEAMQVRLDAAIASNIIEYLGPYDNADVRSLMGECDYVLMASRWWENSPVVIQEAFAARRPLIVPGIGGMAEKVTDRVSGFHFKVGDSADLARVVRMAAGYDPRQFTLPSPTTPREMAASYLAAIDPRPAQVTSPSEVPVAAPLAPVPRAAKGAAGRQARKA